MALDWIRINHGRRQYWKHKWGERGWSIILTVTVVTSHKLDIPLRQNAPLEGSLAPGKNSVVLRALLFNSETS